MNGQPQPFDYYINALKFKYAQFTGRARRSEFWYFTLFNFLISAGIGLLDIYVGSMALNGIYALAVLIPGLAVTVRRLHDTGKSGLWILIALIPVVGTLILLIFLVQDSQPFTNKWGPNPKETIAQNLTGNEA
jgi:uncharacterized membrane protein YhaH (DUF805 family)